MSLRRIRCGVRVAAGIIGLVAGAYGASAVQTALQDDGDLDGAAVTRDLVLVMVVAATWVVVEAIVGGFEEIARRTQERYDELEKRQPDAYSIAAQACCETYRLLTEQAATESDKVRILHR